MTRTEFEELIFDHGLEWNDTGQYEGEGYWRDADKRRGDARILGDRILAEFDRLTAGKTALLDALVEIAEVLNTTRDSDAISAVVCAREIATHAVTAEKHSEPEV